MSKTRDWWNQKGFSQLNQILVGGSSDWDIPLIGSGIGNVPLTNLIDVPQEVNLSELTEILRKEGLKAILWSYGKCSNDYEVILNL